MDFIEFSAIVKRQIPDLLNEPGEVFFGSKQSLRKSNGIAIVGLNPGGSGLSSIEDNLRRYEEDSTSEYFSSYLDRCWHEPSFSKYETCQKCEYSLRVSQKIRQDDHQKRVERIANEVGFDLRETLSLNAIWIQTRSAWHLQDLLKARNMHNMSNLFLDRFFPVFDHLFEDCGINLIVCLGNGKEDSPFEFFRLAYGIESTQVVVVGDHYRNGKYFEKKINGRETLVFGVPHPSRFNMSPLGIRTLAEKRNGYPIPARPSL
jgi:hypothetical protein